jgi:phosphoadenosine phosphosulfate reductase
VLLNAAKQFEVRDAVTATGPDARFLAEALAHTSPHDIIETAVRTLPGRLAAVSSFGTESAVLLKLVADVDRSMPVLFLDTLWRFKETLVYRDDLVHRLGLTDVEALAALQKAEIEKWWPVIKEAGIKAE